MRKHVFNPYLFYRLLHLCCYGCEHTHRVWCWSEAWFYWSQWQARLTVGTYPHSIYTFGSTEESTGESASVVQNLTEGVSYWTGRYLQNESTVPKFKLQQCKVYREPSQDTQKDKAGSWEQRQSDELLAVSSYSKHTESYNNTVWICALPYAFPHRTLSKPQTEDDNKPGNADCSKRLCSAIVHSRKCTVASACLGYLSGFCLRFESRQTIREDRLRRTINYLLSRIVSLSKSKSLLIEDFLCLKNRRQLSPKQQICYCNQEKDAQFQCTIYYMVSVTTKVWIVTGQTNR